MRSRFYAFAVTALFAAATAMPALAQAPNLDPPNSEAPKPPDHPPTDVPALPEPPPDVQKFQRGPPLSLDKLFEALKVAPTDESAKFVENRIWALWLASGGDTANLLMSRVKSALDSKDYDLAIKLLNAIIDIRPNYIEAWNRVRATIPKADPHHRSVRAGRLRRRHRARARKRAWASNRPTGRGREPGRRRRLARSHHGGEGARRRRHARHRRHRRAVGRSE